MARRTHSWDADPWLTDLDLEDFDLAEAGLLTLVPGLWLNTARLREEARGSHSITIVGETGTGKELLASAIHRLSRRPGSYVAINCGAIAPDLIQSELFGHVRGAFTGARGGIGHLREADGGTLLLDEIIEAPPDVQVALLRVMQEKTVTPVGGTRAHRVDVRFIAASQHPLSYAVVKNGFRLDLQGRLEAFTFELPSLRCRREDIGILVAHGLRSMGVSDKDRPRLSPQAALRLFTYDWPRNIRELIFAINRAWRGAREGSIGHHELPVAPATPIETPALRDQIIDLLRICRGNVTEVSHRMGRARPLVHRWIVKFGIDPESFRR